MAVDYSTQVNSLIVGQNVRWTNFTNYQTNSRYVRPLGSPTVVTYSFDQILPSYMPGSQAPGFRSLTDPEKSVVRTAANIWDNASGVVMMEVAAGQGQIQVGAYDFDANGPSNLLGYASYPGYSAGGDVWFNTRSEIGIGLALHELGHALGLKHPFEPLNTGVVLPTVDDKTTNTVMSYTGAHQPQIGPYDTAAIQYLYGPNVPVDAVYPTGYTAQSYLAANPDLLRAFGPNFEAANNHYLASGIWDGRPTSFDALGYIASNPDLIRAFGVNAQAGTDHYIHSGINEGRSTNSFNALAYLATYTDLEAAFGRDQTAATQHYVAFGAAEGRTVTFDPYAYLAANWDLMFAFQADTHAAARHYLDFGRTEGRKTTGFDAKSYLTANADLAAAFGSNEAAATRHYIEFGIREGRPTFVIPTIPTFHPAMADALPRLSTPDTAAFAARLQPEMAAPLKGGVEAGLFSGSNTPHTALGLHSPGW